MQFSILSFLSFLPGCKDLPHLSWGENCQYTTAQSLLEAFSDINKEEFLQQLQGNPYLSVLLNESTDSMIMKKIII